MTTIDYPSEFSAKVLGYADSFDVEGSMTMLADDVALRFANGPVAIGKDAVRDTLAHMMSAIAAMHHRVLNEWQIEDRIIHQLEITYTRHDGKEITVPAVTIYRLSGDLIAEYLNYVDLAPLSA